MTTRRLLVTGAAGRVADMLLPALAEAYPLRLTDRRPVGFSVAGADSEIVIGDLADPRFLDSLVRDVDVVVHLAGNPDQDASWGDLRDANVDAVASLLDASARAGVRRVILASSVHAAGQYDVNGYVPVDAAWPASPCCTYGATKAWGEAAGAAASYRSDLSVICLRFGATLAEPLSPESLAVWLGPADLIKLVGGAITCTVRFGVYHGVSANMPCRWSYASATADLGYRPQLSSAAYADGVRNVVQPIGSLCQPGR